MSQASIFVEIKSAWPLSARDDLSELCAKDSWTADVESREAVGQLSSMQIEALGLTKLQGAVAEAAKRTGTSISSIKARVHRASA
jgi:hypothetical protein